MKNSLVTIIVAMVLLGATVIHSWAFAAPPNILVILTDDQGYADISLNPHHPKKVSTPHMDALDERQASKTLDERKNSR
ncbi:MAG: hypothetical protein H8E44_13165 [Planctomycetes bacterium]|nr:hypothetical protein [Planctomycetota bacterium]MBL7040211.1 hypothetical protein [Pirellulaceae bacterium]